MMYVCDLLYTNMSTIQKFEDLEVWQLAKALSKDIFTLTQTSKLSKDYSLKDQINRSSGSAMDNIAEGFGRASRLEFVQFLSIAGGSVDEVKSQLYRCLDRVYITQEEFQKYYDQAMILSKQIKGFIKYLNSSLIKGTKFKDRNIEKNNGLQPTDI